MDSITDNRAVVNSLIQEDANIQALILKDINSRGKERPWRLHKLNNEKLYNIVSKAKPPIYNNSQLFNIRECANTLFFKEVENNRLKLQSGFFCQIRLCPLCTWRRSLKLFSQISKIISWINNKNNVKYLFVTLTIKNCQSENLKDTLDKLNLSFKKLVGNSRNFKSVLSENLVGYLKVIEITYNSKDNTYHPHIHAILSVRPSYFKGKNYLSKKKLSMLWGKCLGVDYSPSIDVRAIKDNSPKAIAEIAKYPIKLVPVLDINNAENVIRTLKITMQNRRLITMGGLFKQAKQALKLVDVETDTDLIHTDTNEDADEASRSSEIKYTWCAGYYFRVAEGE